MERRQVLRNLSVAAAIPVLSGCLNDSTSGANTTSTASTGPTTAAQSPTRQPPRGLEGVTEFPRKPPETDVECGDEALEYVEPKSGPHVQRDSGLELTASEETIAIGDEITFSLRNVSDEPVKIGNIHKYNIKRQTEQGWEPIFQTPFKAWHDDAENLLPGAGYDWPFIFTQRGLERDHQPTDVSYLVCSPLEPGTYYFVFWGTISDDLPGKLLGTPFTVEPA